jgi:PPOX class probable F420-dependent enzyme
VSALGPVLKEFLDERIVGVLATVAEDGRTHQSVVYFARDGDRLLVSTESGRHKARDVRRTGWASLCVMGRDRPFASATLSGRAEILTDDIGPATAAVMHRIMGLDAPAPEVQSDEALAGVGRVILAITVEHVGPVSYLETGETA